ncbi:MAG: hypothetical protein Q8R28_14950 [Dehalococcoidia bacterium]|nr:hypothetical protein [Dehalococcoidia bacterium]
MTSLYPDESSVDIMRRADAALAEVRSKVLASDEVPISFVAEVAKRHRLEPADVMRALEHSPDCYVDWQGQRVVCR